MIGKTNSSQGVSSIPSEYVNIRMMTNQASHGDLVGAKFVLSYEKFSQEYAWGGSEMTLQVPAYVVCTIEWGDVEGYKKPEAVTFTTVEDNARTIEVEYKCELLTVNVSADEGSVSGFEVTISKAETIDGIKGYTRLEYIESTGTQYIDTGFKPNQDTRVVADMYLLSTNSNVAADCLFGARTSASSKAFAVQYNNTSGRLQYFYGDGNTYTSSSIPNSRTICDANKNILSYNGKEITRTYTPLQCEYSLYLFALNNVGKVSSQSIARLYSCQIYDNGTLVRDYIPVKDSNGVAGLYDKVNNVFYQSNSDSNFIAGKEITYKKIEYIESTGTQWIDTGFNPDQNTKMYLDVAFLSSVGTNVAGVRNSASDTTNRFGIISFGSASKIGAFFRDSSIQSIAYDTSRHAYELSKSGLVVDGTSYGSSNSGTFACTYPITLGAWNNGAGGLSYNNSRIYACKIYDNGALVRDYVPALRSNGVAGLYDVVNDAFYASSGSDNFISGGERSKVIGVQTSASGMYKIPFGTSYDIEASDIDGFETPKPVSRVASEKEFVATMKYKAVDVKDLSLMDVYGNKIQRSTANCYVVREAGQYKFPLVFGNAIKNGKVNTAAFTNNGGAYSHDFVYGTPYTSYESDVITQPYINPYFAPSSSDVQIETSDVDGAITDLGLEDGNECKFVTFKVANVPTTGGNVIITLNTAYGDYWSWHIWLWPHDLSPVEITNATGVKYKIMPVNLASKYDSDGVHIKNWFYQWGRPNPMLCPNAWNSTTDHSPGVITKTSKADTLKLGIMNPTKFYYNSSSPYNWFGTKSYYNLWDAACTGTGNSDNDTVKTVYDPCPVGWKVPNGNTFTGLSMLSSANGIVKMRRYSGDTVGVGFSMSGCRDYSDGSLYDVGSYGYVWLSSATSQGNAFRLYFYSSDVYPQYSSYRSAGYSVRPVQDDNIQLDVIMISFMIITSDYIEWTCEAESGMTWFEWVNSEYNTAGAVMNSSTGTVRIGGIDIKDYEMYAIKGTDRIIGGETYIL